ncbi:unnamed protein product [Camellia sinensis]
MVRVATIAVQTQNPLHLPHFLIWVDLGLSPNSTNVSGSVTIFWFFFMGCVTLKQAVSVTPALNHSSASRQCCCGGLGEEPGKWGERVGESGRVSSNGGGGESLSFRLGNLQKYVEGEQVAAGWPAWLSAVAGEAIHGWVPLSADSFEKLEKVGQGTYSSVFHARNLETGRIVALKKVRFDNFEPESVRFMAREIMILRRLDHPNIIKMEGLITSRLSCSIYLVFEYMEHDISGLLSSPDIKLSEAQVKCYMEQLLSGLEHCHSRGTMHRDIKGANLLVNNEGVLKMADFGLANFYGTGPVGHRQPLTSRVVTLWYRPPELLLGSTDYEASVDLWSVGCVFAELLLGSPILQGRTEVVIFVDNSGADTILGILPFARELLRRGMQIPEDARSNAWVSFDGKRRQQLSRGDSVRISMSQHPLPTVNKSDQTGDWFHSLIRCLNWNERLDQKAL